jgi:hypothetical protein
VEDDLSADAFVYGPVGAGVESLLPAQPAQHEVDEWVETDDQLVRIHRVARMFSFIPSEDLNWKMQPLLSRRLSVWRQPSGDELVVEDTWSQGEQPPIPHGPLTGRTYFWKDRSPKKHKGSIKQLLCTDSHARSRPWVQAGAAAEGSSSRPRTQSPLPLHGASRAEVCRTTPDNMPLEADPGGSCVGLEHVPEGNDVRPCRQVQLRVLSAALTDTEADDDCEAAGNDRDQEWYSDCPRPARSRVPSRPAEMPTSDPQALGREDREISAVRPLRGCVAARVCPRRTRDMGGETSEATPSRAHSCEAEARAQQQGQGQGKEPPQRPEQQQLSARRGSTFVLGILSAISALLAAGGFDTGPAELGRGSITGRQRDGLADGRWSVKELRPGTRKYHRKAAGRICEGTAPRGRRDLLDLCAQEGNIMSETCILKLSKSLGRTQLRKGVLASSSLRPLRT